MCISLYGERRETLYLGYWLWSEKWPNGLPKGQKWGKRRDFTTKLVFLSRRYNSSSVSKQIEWLSPMATTYTNTWWLFSFTINESYREYLKLGKKQLLWAMQWVSSPMGPPPSHASPTLSSTPSPPDSHTALFPSFHLHFFTITPTHTTHRPPMHRAPLQQLSHTQPLQLPYLMKPMNRIIPNFLWQWNNTC